jgi:2-iminobutanoate/2-iminopropanoate deaminase
MPKQVVETDRAPEPVGPYSQAIATADFVFTAGQIGIAPGGKELVGDDVAAQAKQALDNLKNVLMKAGCGIEDAVKTTVFLTNMDDFAALNEVYAAFFHEHPPARSVVEVARLPLGARVEIECIAHK